MDIDNQNLTILIHLDYSKVLGMVDHDILLLRNISLSQGIIHWFLTNPSQHVVVPGKPHSKPLFLSKGIPQGSSLSPTLLRSISNYQNHHFEDYLQMYLSF